LAPHEQAIGEIKEEKKELKQEDEEVEGEATEAEEEEPKEKELFLNLVEASSRTW
jgi:hypothetical protein